MPSTTNVTDTFGFNSADQMTSISDSNGSTLFSATYTRDSAGQLISDSSQAANQRNYKYTALNQLCYAGSSASNACSSPPASSYPYASDNAGNLTKMENAAHTGSTTQQFNNADELCWTVSGSSANACGSVPSGATTYGFNTNGDRTSAVPSTGPAKCDGYDQANRLTKIQTGTGSSCTSPTTVGTYAYDGTGMRASKTVSGSTTHYTWDGTSGNLMQEKTGSTATSYIYGPGGMPVEQIVGYTTTYLHHDQLGSTVLVTDAAGATSTVSKKTYDPYGNVVTTSGSLTTHLMYTGQYLDSESGLYYNRARYYDPTTAQFLTRDPMVGLTLSPYAYVAGNPLNDVDPSGMFGLSDIGNAIGTVVTGAGNVAGTVSNDVGNVASAVGTGVSNVENGAGNAATWVSNNKLETLGIAAGVLAAGTGVGALVEGSLLLGAVSITAGGLATSLDGQACLRDHGPECVGAILGVTSLAASGIGLVGDLAMEAGTTGAIVADEIGTAGWVYGLLGLGYDLGVDLRSSNGCQP